MTNKMNILRRVQRAFRERVLWVCLCGLSGIAFTACDPNEEANVDPIYAVDLGLSVKWAWCNLGANRPDEEGDEYAWGETATKYRYEQSNYEFYDNSTQKYVNIGSRISGTSYDVARATLGDGWRMPTNEEVQELIERCTWEKAYLWGEDGMFVTGPNGNRIFLPNASSGYWSGAYSSENDYYKYAHSLTWNYSLPWNNGQDANVRMAEKTSHSGLAIRPVYSEEPKVEEPEVSNKPFTVNGVSFTMISVEGGTFTMGATSEQGSDASDDEKPAHQVTLSSYAIGETEVTQALWQAVMGSNPSYSTDSQRPVEQVNWNDCQKFISKLNELTGENFRLPTEAEWEYAARGGKYSKGYIYSGSNTIGDVAWYDGNSSSETHPVKTKQPNELGIYDMSGNVLEWCADWYGSYSSSVQIDPTGPSSGSYRVIRGGRWAGSARLCRVASRDGLFPDGRINNIGLRLVYSEASQPVVTIETGEATDVTTYGATLSGMVSGTDETITCGIIYGTSSDLSLNDYREETSANGTYSVSLSNLQPGTTYYYCAYVVVDDEYKYGETCSFTTEQESGTGEYEAVDLGLSVKWATFNVGATSPEEYGSYFAWGDTETKDSYSGNNFTYGLSTSELRSQGIIDANGNLNPSYDAATVNWGSGWRMPTFDEIQELKNNCDWEWITINGVNGCRVMSRINGNSIFFPVAGCHNVSSLNDVGTYGYYWSATPYSENNLCAYNLFFRSEGYGWNYNIRGLGFSVRPVSEY